MNPFSIILLNLDEWRKIRPHLSTYTSDTQLNITTQAFLLGLEYVFENTPFLESITLSYQKDTQEIKLKDLEHPEVDSQYGIPVFLFNRIDSLLEPIRGTNPVIENLFKPYFEPRTFKHPSKAIYEKALLEQCLGLNQQNMSLFQFLEMRNSKALLSSSIEPAQHFQQKPSLKIRL